MHNLSTVMRFEIVRTLKKKSFWLMALGFPLMFAALFGIIFLSNSSTYKASEKLKEQKFSFAITDDSGLINPVMVKGYGATIITDKDSGIQDVKSGKLDAYIYYPKDIANNSIKVYGKDVGIFDNGRYSGIANNLLSMSVEATINNNVKSVVKGATNTTVTTYRDGVEFDPSKQMILPGLFLVLFYMLFAFFGNQMLTSTTEEKENRVIEMLLTTVNARTLIIGKIYSLIALVFIQGLIVVLPALTGYLLFKDKLKLPDFDLSSLPVDPARISIGALIFVASFLLFTGLMVAIGAAVPTAKEASGFIGIIMMLIFGPLYAISLFISAPTDAFVRFLTLFPFTAPIPMLLRNAVGNLQPWETIAGVVILMVTATITMSIAVRVFRYGALEYSRKLSLREIFSSK